MQIGADVEPSPLASILNWCFIHLLPFLAFWSGVYISVSLRLHGSLSPKHIYLTSIPVGFITVGNLLSMMQLETMNENQGTVLTYGYMNSPSNLFIFVGTLMFYGTMAPQLFSQISNRIQQQTKAEGQ